MQQFAKQTVHMPDIWKLWSGCAIWLVISKERKKSHFGTVSLIYGNQIPMGCHKQEKRSKGRKLHIKRKKYARWINKIHRWIDQCALVNVAFMKTQVVNKEIGRSFHIQLNNLLSCFVVSVIDSNASILLFVWLLPPDKRKKNISLKYCIVIISKFYFKPATVKALSIENKAFCTKQYITLKRYLRTSGLTISSCHDVFLLSMCTCGFIW